MNTSDLCPRRLLVSILLCIIFFAGIGDSAIVDATWMGPASGNWNLAANWSAGAVPNNGANTYNVFIDDETVQVNGLFAVDAANIASGIVNIGSTSAQSLGLAFGTSVIGGKIRLVDHIGYGGDAILYINAPIALADTGSVDFASSGTNYISGAGTLTVGETFTVQSVSGGSGNVNTTIINNGTIQANGGTISLNENIANNNLIRSLSGTVNLNTLTINNVSGQLSVQSGSSFNITNSAIEGGLLTGSGVFNIDGTSNTFDGTSSLTTVDAGATVQFGTTSAENLTVKNGITNNGIFKLTDYIGYGGEAKLLLEGSEADRDVAFDGSGQILFASSGENYIDNSASDLDARLKITSGQTVTTTAGANGEIYSEVLNDGLISADDGTITLYENIVNNNILSSVSTGIMTLNALTVDNTAGQLSVASGSSFNILNSDISGGLLTGGGVFNINGTSTFDGSAAAINISASAVNLGTTSQENLHLKGTIDNDSLIRLNDSGGYGGSAEILCNGTVNLNGSGQIAFITNGSNYIKPTAGGGSLVIGSSQTIAANAGSVGYIHTDTINNGIIRNTDGTLYLQNGLFTNNNLIDLINTANTYLSTTFENSLGTVNIETGSVLNTSGSAKINGGTIAGGGKITIDGTGTQFENLQLDSGITTEIGTTAQETLTLKNTITNNGTIKLLDSAGYGGEADIKLSGGDVLLDGSGEVRFGTNGTNRIISTTGTEKLIIGSNQTIKTVSGAAGTITAQTINNGTIASDGGTLTMPTSLTNNGLVRSSSLSTLTVSNNVAGTGNWRADNGTIKIQNGANVSTTGDITIVNNGKLQLVGSNIAGSDLIMGSTGIIDISSSVSISDDVAFAMTDETKWKWSTSSALQMTGGTGTGVGSWGGWGSLEIGGYDYGTNPANHIGAAAGFTNNFSLPQLVIGADAHIYLADLMDNGNRNGSLGFNEALYVNTLTFADGAGLLNLNGLHLYYNTLVGNSEQIIDIAVPEPATITILLIGSLAFTRLPRIHKVTKK